MCVWRDIELGIFEGGVAVKVRGERMG